MRTIYLLGVLAAMQVLVWGLERGLRFCISSQLLRAVAGGPWSIL